MGKLIDLANFIIHGSCSTILRLKVGQISCLERWGIANTLHDRPTNVPAGVGPLLTAGLCSLLVITILVSCRLQRLLSSAQANLHETTRGRGPSCPFLAGSVALHCIAGTRVGICVLQYSCYFLEICNQKYVLTVLH